MYSQSVHEQMCMISLELVVIKSVNKGTVSYQTVEWDLR